MKKKILSLTLIAMSLVAFTGMAQNKTDNNSPKKELVKGQKGDRKDMKADRPNPFEGINLTDAQKTKLQELNAKQKADRQQQAQARKDEKKRNDQAKATDRRASKKAYLEEVKAIIGPDNYVVFLENMYINGGGQGHGKAIKQGQRGGKDGIAHNRGDKQRGDKQGRGERQGRNKNITPDKSNS